MDFRHYTDRSVGLAVDLVNTYWWAAEKEEMPDVGAFERWLEAHGESAEVDDAQLAEVKDDRKRLRRAFDRLV